MLLRDTYESPLGTLWLTGTKRGLTGLSFAAQSGQQAVSGEFDLVKKWLDSYFQGEPSVPDFPMMLEGTDFQKLIWHLLLKIPFGQTRTYGQLAREAAEILGKETMSAQAVGQAVGRNPIAIIIPCHRCLGAGGKLTGYAYGVKRKAWLLEHERKQEAN